MQVIQSIQDLEALRDDWNELADRHERPLLRHEWFSCCARTLHREQDLRVVVIRRGGRLVAAAPLAIEPTTAGTRLEFLGASVLGEPSGLVFRGREDLEALLEAVVQLGLPVQLQRLDAASGIPEILRRHRRWPCTSLVLRAAASFVVPTAPGWAEYYQSLSSSITDNLRRLRRRAERLLGVRVECLSPGVQEVDGLLDVFARIEGSGWKGRRGTALRAKPQLAEFFRQYAHAAAGQGWLRVFVLRIGDHVAAMEFDVQAYCRLWQLKIGYDETMREHYPGLQLVQESIRYAFETGLQAFEFLGSAASWQKPWHPETREYRTALAYPFSARGMWGLARDLSGAAVRRMRRLAGGPRRPAKGDISRPVGRSGVRTTGTVGRGG